MDLYHVLLGPVTTEKTVRLQEASQHTFMIHKDATKIDVMNAIRLFYGVAPEAVRIIHTRKKERLLGRGRTMTKRKPGKKAIVRLPKGKSLELVSTAKKSASSSKKK